MNPLAAALQARRENGLYRSLTPLLNAPAKFIQRDGVLCLNCASNNYLDLAGHPKIVERSREFLEEDGSGSGGSRLLGGDLPRHEVLEMAIAKFRPLGSALLFNSGFQANVTMVPALGEALGGVFADKMCHASVADGLRLAAASVDFHRFRHNDLNHLEDLLKKHQPAEGGLVVAETLYSMDGDFAPLADLAALQKRYGFWLLWDEAHSVGCHPGLETGGWGMPERTVMMGTFGKALGSFGAYAAGPDDLAAFLINYGRGFIFSTSLPPAVLGANLAALEVVQDDQEAWRPGKLREISGHARAVLQARGFDLGASQSQIIPIHLGTPEQAAHFSARLFDEGIHAPAIRPPTVPEGTSRLRINVTAAFTEADVTRIADALTAARESGS